MSDETPTTEIVRRDDARLTTLERALGGGDMVQMIEATKRNVNAAIAFAREREFVSEYPIMKKVGNVQRQVGVRLWFHHPTWQLLGQSFGVTAYTDGEPKEVKPGVWQAAAVAAIIEDGRIIGRSVGLCSKSEPGKSGERGPAATDHTLAAIAQARAQRNALRSALGAVLIAAGFEISDPEGPATKEQLGQLHRLARTIGWDDDQAHAEAGDIDSFTELNRDQASDLIERWKVMAGEKDREEGSGRADTSAETTAPTPPPAATSGGTENRPLDEEPLGEQGDGEAPEAPRGSTVDEAWARAPHDMGRVAAIKLAAKLIREARMPGPPPGTQAAFTAEQVAKVSSAYRDGERG